MREILPSHQAAQARAVLEDAARHPGPAVVAGDLNRRGVGRLFEAHGWRWLTRDVGRTHWVWSFDHVFVRGVDAGSARAGSIGAALEVAIIARCGRRWMGRERATGSTPHSPAGKKSSVTTMNIGTRIPKLYAM